MTGPRHCILKYDGPALPPIGSRFTHDALPQWSFTLVGMHPCMNTHRMILDFDDGQTRSYTEGQFRALVSQPGFKFESMKEFEVP